ncbi:polygalacturonase 1 beta-like protein 2 [Coffea arabica]|uniref:Polygalacturonase 1 beta-like protein 2 n=1 Tax=Coffea arabica TaxID=13443 RepID=A0A6P6XCS9_COFAR|nr:polygalacturonase 1 beta-like protein 3 [Coffea arabica]
MLVFFYLCPLLQRKIPQANTDLSFSYQLKMDKMVKISSPTILFSFLFLSALSFNVSLAKESPLTARASLVRYWNKHISNYLPKPHFLLSKASPLSIVDSAYFTKLAAQKALSSHLSSFCSSANLFCLFDEKDALTNSKKDADFAFYTNKHFANYGSSRLGGIDMFKNYSNGVNFATGSFARYSRSSNDLHEDFTSYADDGNVANANFTSYGSGARGGSGDFKNYLPRVNVPDLRFTSYDSDGNNHKLSFSSYVDDTNSGSQAFTNYAKNGNGVPLDFTSYGDTSNVIGSAFSGYGELGNAANDSFKAYGRNANNPSNNFKNYGSGGNSGIDSFVGYRDSANAGTDTFQSYGRSSNSETANFVNYGKSFNEGIDTFKEYGKAAKGQSIGFKIYGVNNTFKDYAKNGVTFALYTKPSSSKGDDTSKINSKSVNKWVDEGKFFREYMLKDGTIIKMPDIRDKMPKRSFLPRLISSKLPFSTNELSAIKRIFHALDNSTLERVIVNALEECERAASRGESKRCVGSVEDMIDFAVSVLGRNVVVRTTENVRGSNHHVMIGKVQGVNGGRVTKSVSCHQSLYPYLLYYCHSVPKVKVYLADILDVVSKTKINHGVAICHIDTSAWSPNHGAFVALGSGPGLIEVCHWIFENDMTWTIAD